MRSLSFGSTFDGGSVCLKSLQCGRGGGVISGSDLARC